MFSIFLQDGEDFIMKVWTFEQISNVLKAAGEGKCLEAQACLEGMHNLKLIGPSKLK